MRLLETLKKMDLEKYTVALISTSKKSSESRLLPFHELLDRVVLNIMVGDETIAKEVIGYLDQYIQYLFVDIERKKKFDLWDIAKLQIKKTIILPYKPNDMTREAAYYFICKHFNYELKHKKIIIYGCGNIGTKLALYLAENQAEISLVGRNKSKIKLIKNTLNAILPEYNSTKIGLFSQNEMYDGLITCLSGNHVVDIDFLQYLKNGAVVIDIGISNLSPEFILKACMHSIKIYRLDVRMGTPFLSALLQNHLSTFIEKNIGKVVLEGTSCVSGGLIGKEGDIVLDTIYKPKLIIGIANGTGGIKKYNDYNKIDRQNIKKIDNLLARS